MGRPKNETNDRQVVPCTTDEKESWRTAAATTGTPLNAWARAVLTREAAKAHHVPPLRRRS